MEGIRSRSHEQEIGALRARVAARRSRAQRWQTLRSLLSFFSPRQPGVLQLARRRRRFRLPELPYIDLGFEIPIPRQIVEFCVVVALVALVGFVIAPRALPGARHAKQAAAAAAPLATPTATLPPASGEPVRIMLLGSDKRGDDPSFRTDVIMLVTVSPKLGEISVLSFPRDLVGKIPGYGDSRINVVMAYGGFQSLQDTFDESYGARPKYFFMINFDAFVGLINSMGGIEIDAAEELADSCDLPQSRGGICTIKPGRQEMDGAMALWYVRSRHSTSDFDRLRRAQEVLGGLFRRFMQRDAPLRLAEFYLQYSEYVETNMDLGQVMRLLPVAVQVFNEPERIHRFAITHDITADWIMPDGAHVQLPDYEAVKEIVREASFPE